MRLGYVSMNTPSDVRPDRLARALEDRGYDSLFVGEHSHIPTSRLTPYPAGGELPDSYLHMMDPYVSLTLAASATTTLTIGTGVALPLERDLLALAKTVATLDVLSSGRWSSEWESAGTPRNSPTIDPTFHGPCAIRLWRNV